MCNTADDECWAWQTTGDARVVIDRATAHTGFIDVSDELQPFFACVPSLHSKLLRQHSIVDSTALN